jgi:hypothetical protein
MTSTRNQHQTAVGQVLFSQQNYCRPLSKCQCHERKCVVRDTLTSQATPELSLLFDCGDYLFSPRVTTSRILPIQYLSVVQNSHRTKHLIARICIVEMKHSYIYCELETEFKVLTGLTMIICLQKAWSHVLWYAGTNLVQLKTDVKYSYGTAATTTS